MCLIFLLSLTLTSVGEIAKSLDEWERDMEQCCDVRSSFYRYPYGKVWISTSGSNVTNESIDINASNVFNYTLYDQFGTIQKLWAYEVDNTATVLTMEKLFEADSATMRCPAGHWTANPRHRYLTAEDPKSKMLCIHENDQARLKMIPGKWYAVCVLKSCTVCHLDMLRNTQQYVEYAELQSAEIAASVLRMNLTIVEPGMRYFAKFQFNEIVQTLGNLIIMPNDSVVTVRISNLTENIYKYPIQSVITPWLRMASFGCPIVARQQFLYFPQLKNE